ncbi:MAG: permease-like cell division protein FtsX [Lachnospiraceae bacterium]|nr:permease-like cell division protein FtsX [Lachnospiraceae bacterium]
MLYSMKQAFQNIFRNRFFSLASIGTIGASIFIFGVIYMVLMNVEGVLHSAEKTVGITVFFEEGTKEEDIFLLKEELLSGGETEKVEYTSAKEAWESFQKDYFNQDEELIKAFGEDNPLKESASLDIYLKNVESQKKLVGELKENPIVRKVNSSDTIAKQMSQMNRMAGLVSAALLGILLIVAVFLIQTTIRTGIFVRRDEIAIMKLIGATDGMVRAPFVIEGIVIGIVGACIPLAVLYVMYVKLGRMIVQQFGDALPLFSIVDTETIFVTLVPIAMVLGVGIGLFGSIITVRRHIRV